MVPQQSFIPQHLPEISATAEFSETPCGGRPVPRKTGGSLQNRLVVNLEFFRVHFWALWYLRSTAFSPGSLLRVLPRHFPPNRAIEVASCCVPGGNPQKSHVQSTPPKRRHAAWTPAVGVLMAPINAEKHALSPPSIRVQNGRQATALEVRQYGHRTTRHRRHAKITDSNGPGPILQYGTAGRLKECNDGTPR